ncbi:nuclear transport factor 2 family protein [Alloalcanivorax mobilis]|uniref:nuclear transport factor 2 family protein n=1 Tax=Alloalcanivorax mobilis TaxID=2019569 RepID=UPI000C788FCC|nr:nuclear transport factor 2 family protein [Alloalcanivorax mobilis]
MIESPMIEGAAIENTTMADAAAFVARFEAFWAAPSVEKMATILTSDVILIQPLAQPMHGLESACAEFQRLFRWLPDLRATVA